MWQLDWRHLEQCRRLCTLHLSFTFGSCAPFSAEPMEKLQRVLDACAATLEELRLDKSIRFRNNNETEAARKMALDRARAAARAAAWAAEGAAFLWPHLRYPGIAAAAPAQPHTSVPDDWSALARCSRLRVLCTAMQRDETDTAAMLTALSQLPAFESLELALDMGESGWNQRADYDLPPGLLRFISRSRSWRSLHLHRLADSQPADPLQADARGGLPARMPPATADDATAKRLCVHDHRAGCGSGAAAVPRFTIRPDAQGAMGWQRLQ